MHLTLEQRGPELHTPTSVWVFIFFTCGFLKISFFNVFSLMISLITFLGIKLTLLKECSIYVCVGVCVCKTHDIQNAC